MKRAARLGNGNVPPVIQAAYDDGQRALKQEASARERAESLCGPDCLAELLRREGKSAAASELAREMGTSDKGTSLAAFSAALQKRGYEGRGLLLTGRSLRRQALPVVASFCPAIT